MFTPQTMKLLGSTKSKITKDKIGKNVSCLEIRELVLVHCNIGNNGYQHDSRVLYTFVPNKSFCQLINFIFSKTFNSEFPHIEVWFTYQNSKPIEIEEKIEDEINITFVIN